MQMLSDVMDRTRNTLDLSPPIPRTDIDPTVRKRVKHACSQLAILQPRPSYKVSYQDWDQGLAWPRASDTVEEVEGEDDALECLQPAEASG